MHIDQHVDSTRTSTVQCTCIIAFIGISLVSLVLLSLLQSKKWDQNMMTETERTNGEKKFAPKNHHAATQHAHCSTFNSQLISHQRGKAHAWWFAFSGPLSDTTLGDNDLAWRYLVEARCKGIIVGSGSVRRNPIPARDVQEI